MKVIVHLELHDDERGKLAQNWFKRKALVTRQEVNDFVNTKIQIAILDGGTDHLGPDCVADAQTEAIVANESTNGGTKRVSEFVPSRGDEPYMLKVRDPQLKDILSRMLDVTEEYDTYVWEKLEDDRI